MRHSDGKSSLERGAAPDLWRHTLSQIPSLFGRLVYLCSLRDRNNGTYEHYGLAQVFGDSEADRVLRESHQQVFASWVCLTLEQQKTDLDLYLSESDRGPAHDPGHLDPVTALPQPDSAPRPRSGARALYGRPGSDPGLAQERVRRRFP